MQVEVVDTERWEVATALRSAAREGSGTKLRAVGGLGCH